MIKNYFKIVLRNMLKHSFFSAINILGMTVGITACLLILLYIQDELGFDRFHANAERIYQAGLHGKIGDQDISTANTCPPLAATLVAEVPEVESACRIASFYGQAAVKVNDKSFIEERVFYVDSNFFDFFSFRLLEGDAKTALKEPSSVVITEKIAEKYFGSGSPIGKLMTIGGDNRAFKVTGVAGAAPANSHFKYDFLLSASSNEDLKRPVWLNNWMYTYFTLRPNTSVASVVEKMPALVEKYVGPEIEKFMGLSMKQMKDKGNVYGYYVTALPDIHLRSVSSDGFEPAGNIVYVYSFGIIAMFIIIIACINFMNMSTAKSVWSDPALILRSFSEFS